jgi:hypothetical protein
MQKKILKERAILDTSKGGRKAVSMYPVDLETFLISQYLYFQKLSRARRYSNMPFYFLKLSSQLSVLE